MTSKYPSADPSQPRRGRFRRWLGRVLNSIIKESWPDTTVPQPVLPRTDTVKRNETVTFTTPSKGDAYDFTITAELCLCATGQVSPAQLSATIDGRLTDLVAELKAAARPEARKYPPYRPGAAEPRVAAAIATAVELALAGVPDENGVSLQCSTRVRVDMPDVVRELQRLTVEDQVKLEAGYEHSEQAALRLGELRKVWSEFINEGLPMWNTPYAVLMAQQPAQAAATLFKLRMDRKDEAAKLVDAVAAVAAGSERMDLLEFALATDTALSKTYELLGIAAPPKGADSLFDAPEGQAK